MEARVSGNLPKVDWLCALYHDRTMVLENAKAPGMGRKKDPSKLGMLPLQGRHIFRVVIL